MMGSKEVREIFITILRYKFGEFIPRKLRICCLTMLLRLVYVNTRQQYSSFTSCNYVFTHCRQERVE